MQPDMFTSAVHALHLLLEPTRLLLLFVGVIIGLAIGAARLERRCRVGDADPVYLQSRRIPLSGADSRIRPEILLPIIIALVSVAAFEGEHDWGDLYTLVFFGIIGWIMKRLGWPRPPMVLGIVVGAIFERYLFISTQLYGWGWLWRPAVLGILACVVWALYRPLSQIAGTLTGQLREVGGRKPRLGAAPAFLLAVIVLIVAAIASSASWPHDAKIVPLTACGMALVAAVLNLVKICSAASRRSMPMPTPLWLCVARAATSA